MTTINDIDDFLRILREDEMVRSAVRRELLSEELLELPQRIASLTKSIEEYRESTDQRFDMVVSRLDRQDEMYRQQKESTDQQFAIVVGRLDRQHEMYRRQHDDLGRFRGNYAMYAARKNRYEIARLFALPRFIRRIECNLLDSDVLNKMLNDNYESLDTLGLSEETLDSFPMADMVIEVNDRRISQVGLLRRGGSLFYSRQRRRNASGRAREDSSMRDRVGRLRSGCRSEVGAEHRESRL
ncbi:MAG: hypothetical protein OXC95_09475 [Dehalococcoidia bacterium]|nr:hypothetical protein [Dehalococcoidia bacterium]